MEEDGDHDLLHPGRKCQHLCLKAQDGPAGHLVLVFLCRVRSKRNLWSKGILQLILALLGPGSSSTARTPGYWSDRTQEGGTRKYPCIRIENRFSQYCEVSCPLFSYLLVEFGPRPCSSC